MDKPLPQRRYTKSREAYWQEMFNDLAKESTEHAISGWSSQGLRLRMAAYKRVMPLLKLTSDALVLDLGCGAGAYSRVLGEAGLRVVGIDYAYRVAEAASKRTLSDSIFYLSGDACHLPFLDDLFDHVVCIGLFQSLQKHRTAISEIHRILKPGGSLCLMSLNRRNLKNRLDHWLRREEIIMVDKQPHARLNTYDPAKFTTELAETGFNNIKLFPVQVYPEAFNRHLQLVSLWNRLPICNYMTARSFMTLAWVPGE